MKVLCINSSSDANTWDTKLLKEGSIYTAVKEVNGRTKDFQIVPCYELAEIDCAEYVFAQKRFIPLSEIDEHELSVKRVLQEVDNYFQSKQY